MKIDIKNPIISSLLSVLITFITVIIILYITKPIYITKVYDDGVENIDYYLLVSYSLLFGVLVGIIVLLIVSDCIPKKTLPIIINSDDLKHYVPN